nr:MAG TPA: hypothetical protein [Bacteriophage sp.]
MKLICHGFHLHRSKTNMSIHQGILLQVYYKLH